MKTYIMSFLHRDEEQKNNICIPFFPPETPEDFIPTMLIHMKTGDKMAATLGFMWLRSRRNSILHHLSIVTLMKMMFFLYKYKTDAIKKMTAWT